jgi:hypothetical protein
MRPCCAQAAAVRALPPTLDGPLFAARAAGSAEPPEAPPAAAAAALAAPAPSKSAFLVRPCARHARIAPPLLTRHLITQAYSTPGKRPAAPSESEGRPWPQDPSMAAAAAAASLAAAAGLGQPPMGLHPLAAAAPFGLPFGLPPAFALFSAEHLQPAAQAAAQAYALRPAVATREVSGGFGGMSAGGSGSDELSMDPASAKARRAAALKKFQAKRASRCFTKKIRYTSRKQLAEARPRNRGQFVRVKKDADEPGAEDGAALLALAGCSGAAPGAVQAASRAMEITKA